MPSAFPCPDSLTDCECLPFPVRNFSVETPDVPACFGSFNQPATAGTFFAPACFAECESTLTDQGECLDDAVQCAARSALACSSDPPGTGLPPGLPPVPVVRSNQVQSCTVECPDGTTFTEIVPAGTVNSFWLADANARAYALACKRATAKRLCFITDATLDPACRNTAATRTFDVFGGVEPFTYTHTGGTLPTGMALDGNGTLFGIPTATGLFTFNVTVTDGVGSTQTKTFTMRVVQITSPTSLPGATVGTAYSYTLLQTGAGTPLWTLASGTLPDGLTLASLTGIISGTPTTAGTSTFTLDLLDGGEVACTKEFTLVVAAQVSLRGYWTYDDYNTVPVIDKLLDSTANAHNLDILNPYNVVPGRVGNCMSTFENTCETFADPLIAQFDLDITKGFTIAGWTKFDAAQSGVIRVWQIDYGIKFIALDFDLDSLHLYSDTGEETFVAYPADGAWHFFRAWLDTSGILNLQLDNAGIIQSLAGTYANIACTHFQLQGDTTAIPDNLNGFDETGYWQRVLTNTEAANLYNGGAGITFGNPLLPP